MAKWGVGWEGITNWIIWDVHREASRHFGIGKSELYYGRGTRGNETKSERLSPQIGHMGIFLAVPLSSGTAEGDAANSICYCRRAREQDGPSVANPPTSHDDTTQTSIYFVIFLCFLS